MARKIVNRKELRRENEAAEAAEAADGKAGKPAKKAPAKRKSRAKTPKEVRLKAFWMVCNQTGKQVAKYEYSEKKQADKRAAELTVSQKTPHFVQPHKEVITE